LSNSPPPDPAQPGSNPGPVNGQPRPFVAEWVHMGKFNDLNIQNWRESDIWTDSLWIISERDKTGKHNGSYHGNFVPQIPRQLIQRYTKKNETVFDPFLGSGTTAYETESLDRNLIGVEIQNTLVEEVKKNIESKKVYTELVSGDSTKESTFKEVRKILERQKKKNFQLAILHPPYADIIKFSNLRGLCCTKSF